MQTISFFVNDTKPEAVRARERLASFAIDLGMRISSKPDAVVVLGGDGTMLRAAQAWPGVPLLGLNLGSLGYLAAVEVPGFEAAIKALAADSFSISERTMLSVSVGRERRTALNDVVVSRGVCGHMAVIDFSVDSRHVTSFYADGLVIATPTGSTAYSLSAGGPILLPNTSSFAVTPICPHALSSRPIVLPDSARLSFKVSFGNVVSGAEAAVFADGEACFAPRHNDVINVVKAPRTVPLICLSGYNPYRVMARKLGWGGILAPRAVRREGERR